MNGKIALAALAVLLTGTSSYAQQPPQRPARPAATAKDDALDPSPINPATDPDVSKFVNDWRNSKPRLMYGKLVLHDILTKLDSSDPVRPNKKGAVLTTMTSVSYATLAPGASISATARAGEREIFLGASGVGKITVNGKPHDIKDGVGFTLLPGMPFSLANSGKAPLAFYLRIEPTSVGAKPGEDLQISDRFDVDSRVGAHWVHMCAGGPNGLLPCLIAPHTVPQPHSHANEEAWIMVKGQVTLSLGKHLVTLTPGQAYKIPPTGMTAHSNINMSDEFVQMIYMGGARADPAAAAAAPQARPQAPDPDYAHLDSRPVNAATEQDVDMFMGAWRDSYPRVMHGHLIFRDMLTALKGPDGLHPSRKGAVLLNADAVSYASIEPGATAHPVKDELKGVQQTFVVNSGTGSITSGGKTVPLAKDMAFIITPGLDFRLTATGDKFMTFYVVSEKIPEGFTPKASLNVIDNRAKPQVINAWVDKERPLITRADGLSQYAAVTRVEQPPTTMSRPYSAASGAEEIWIATDGDIDLMMGKTLRRLPAGTAYVVPPTGVTAHANINLSGKPAELLYMAK